MKKKKKPIPTKSRSHFSSCRTFHVKRKVQFTALRGAGAGGHVSHCRAGTHREGIVLAGCCPQVTVRTNEITVETLIDGNLFDGEGFRRVSGSVLPPRPPSTYISSPQGIGRDQTDISSSRGVITETRLPVDAVSLTQQHGRRFRMQLESPLRADRCPSFTFSLKLNM